MDEILGYDWNNFISDMGGSLGFLLGLSVIGALSLVEQIFLLLLCDKWCKRKQNENKKTNAPKKIPEITVDDKKTVLKSMEKINNNNNSSEKYYNNIKKASLEKY